MARTVTTDEKLHKVLARAGLGSRRQIEKWIAAGRITVDDQVAQIGDRVDQRARIRVDGKRVNLDQIETRVLIYHKPLDQISSRSDPAGRPTIFTSLPETENGRWISVGRLDINTTGLMLFTNDGELAAVCMHPSGGLEREYLARVHGAITSAELSRLCAGIELDHRISRFDQVEVLSKDSGRNRWYRVVVTEGRYREVRRMWTAVGGRVNRLKRVRYGPVTLPTDLRPGQWREMGTMGVEKLCRCVRR